MNNEIRVKVNGGYLVAGRNPDPDYDGIFYIPVSKYPTLFKKAYNNMDEIVEEFKNKIGKCLSKDFDYRSSIRHIVGTYYG